MKLLRPTMEYDRQIQAFRAEFLACGSSMDGCGRLRRFEDSAAWIAYLRAEQDLTFLCVREEDDRLVGMVQIRPRLENEVLQRYAGHLGYSVAPSQRRRGYGAAILAAAVEKCRDLGLSRILVSCKSDNEGSRRIILRNGGVYESTVHWPERDVWLERYWIEIKANEKAYMIRRKQT